MVMGEILLLELLQVREPLSVFSFTALSAVMEVVWVADGDLLGLVADQADAPPHLGGHVPLEPALPEERVYCLDLVPT